MTDISGSEYSNSMLVRIFNVDMQYVGVTSSSLSGILII